MSCSRIRRGCLPPGPSGGCGAHRRSSQNAPSPPGSTDGARRASRPSGRRGAPRPAPLPACEDLRDAMAIRREYLAQTLVIGERPCTGDDNLHDASLYVMRPSGWFPGHAPWIHTTWCTAVVWRSARRAAWCCGLACPAGGSLAPRCGYQPSGTAVVVRPARRGIAFQLRCAGPAPSKGRGFRFPVDPARPGTAGQPGVLPPWVCCGRRGPGLPNRSRGCPVPWCLLSRAEHACGCCALWGIRGLKKQVCFQENVLRAVCCSGPPAGACAPP